MTTYPTTGAYAQPAYPASFSFDPPERIANWRPLVHWLLAIPHLIVLALLAIALAVVAIVGFFAVLFTGQWPEALRTFALGVGRWWVRVQAYLLLLTDDYPPFTLDELPMPG